MKGHIDFNCILCMPDSGMSKLQELLGSSCFNYINTQYSLLIYGDNGKPIIIEKVLQRVVVDTLGKVKDDINIVLILDDDGINYNDLYKTIFDKLQSIVRDKSKFNPLPYFEENNNLLILKHPKGRGCITIKLTTVPTSLEDQIANKIVEVKCPHNSKILQNGAEKALKYLGKEYYESYEEMIRQSSTWFKGENWVDNIPTFCVSNTS